MQATTAANMNNAKLVALKTASAELNEASDVLTAQWTALEDTVRACGINCHASVEISTLAPYYLGWSAFKDQKTGGRRWRFSFALGEFEEYEPLEGAPREVRAHAAGYVPDLLDKLHHRMTGLIKATEDAAERLEHVLVRLRGSE